MLVLGQAGNVLRNAFQEVTNSSGLVLMLVVMVLLPANCCVCYIAVTIFDCDYGDVHVNDIHSNHYGFFFRSHGVHTLVMIRQCIELALAGRFRRRRYQ